MVSDGGFPLNLDRLHIGLDGDNETASFEYKMTFLRRLEVGSFLDSSSSRKLQSIKSTSVSAQHLWSLVPY